MIDLNNLEMLERHFAEKETTNLFPALAEHYYKLQDLEHARGVCEIGLDIHPDSVDGAFILSKVELMDRNLTEAEKLLKLVVEKNPVHIYGLRLLIQTQITLKRSSNTVRKYVEKLLAVYPDDEDCRIWLKEHRDDEVQEAEPAPVKADVKPAEPEPVQVVAPDEETEPAVGLTQDFITVNARMATFTLADVFKKQRNYIQALEILRLVESKGGDPNRIQLERNTIK
ncbi:MAG: hypothetical protein H8D46_02855, partial [FCB group bacterium]|nr:hypothetical protein [FCB group bacterium]